MRTDTRTRGQRRMAAQWIDPHRGEMLVEMSSEGDVTFSFDGAQDTFSMRDFKIASPTWNAMYSLEAALINVREKWDEGEPVNGV